MRVSSVALLGSVALSPAFPYMRVNTSVAYFDQQMHACVCLRMVENNEKHFQSLTNKLYSSFFFMCLTWCTFLSFPNVFQRFRPNTQHIQVPITWIFTKLICFLDPLYIVVWHVLTQSLFYHARLVSNLGWDSPSSTSFLFHQTFIIEFPVNWWISFLYLTF